MSGAPFDPDWCLAPAALLRDVLTESGIEYAKGSTAALLVAQVMRCDPLTETHAEMLDELLHVPARVWLQWEQNYRDGLAAGKTDTTPEDLN